MNDPTAQDVAQFMLEHLKAEEMLYQETIVDEIQEEFGDNFVYTNENGNLAIGKNVLAEFRKLTEGQVVWNRTERFWRFRQDSDAPGSRMSDD